MVSKNVAEPAQTELTAPIIFGPKKDGSIHFRDEYRKLKNLTRRDSNKIPWMDEYKASLEEETVFCAFEANSKYWQLENEDKEQDKTAFASHHGLNRFVRMPFGSKNVPGKFQKNNERYLGERKIAVHFGLFWSHRRLPGMFEKHIGHERHVPTLLRRAKATLKLKKCFSSLTKLTTLDTWCNQDAYRPRLALPTPRSNSKNNHTTWLDCAHF